jgi:hypothetical protein
MVFSMAKKAYVTRTIPVIVKVELGDFSAETTKPAHCVHN